MSRSFFRRSSSNRDQSSIKNKSIRDFGKHEEDSSSLYGLGSGNGVDKKFKKREPDLIKAFVSEGILPESIVKGVDRGTRSSGASICPTVSPEYEEQSRSPNSRSRPTSSVAELMDTDRSRVHVRREKRFVGTECAVCEEPLEHTLRGERILQFSCGHVSHEACFYEHIKEFESQYCPTCNSPLGLDTNRGRNILDIEKLSNIVRSAPANEPQKINQYPTQPWDNQTIRPGSRDSHVRTIHQDFSQENRFDENNDSWERAGRYQTSSNRHSRQNSDNTRTTSARYSEIASNNGQVKTEHELQAMEIGGSTSISPAPIVIQNPIPPPSVNVRSEFPTLNRSREQQTLTCLVTVEVTDTKWRPNLADLRSIIPSPSIPPPLDEPIARAPSPVHSAPQTFQVDPPEVLEEITENLRTRVDNWHGLDFSRFGKLRLYAKICVGKDKISWQELECFLFAEMLICVKEKKVAAPPQWNDPNSSQKVIKCTLKGSILIKRHLKEVLDVSAEENVLTLSLSVAELPSFYLRFNNKSQLKIWHHALFNINATEWSPPNPITRDEASDQEEEDWRRVADRFLPHRNPSLNSNGGPRSVTAGGSEYMSTTRTSRPPGTVHVPIDIVVVIPISSSMQGVKISIVRDALKFMVQNLGEHDRMGLVTFGSSSGATPLVGMTSGSWNGWSGVLSSIKPIGLKSPRADVGEGANVAMDLLMQRKSNNPITNILLISDSSTSDQETVDFVISRAEAAKIAIHSFGLGMTHKPDTMVELSTRTKASYMYVKDWMMLRECLAGCLGAMQSTSHQNVKLKLHLPEGSPAKFSKISGALQTTKRATGKDAEASLGDLRFGDKRDILVQLVILPDHTAQEQPPQDPWESIVSGLEALSGPLDKEEERAASVEEVPLILADLCWGDILRDGTISHLPRPSLLAITMLPAPTTREKVGSSWSSSNGPPIPPHPNIVQRRMELLTSDMLSRALTLVSRGQHDRAQHLLNETRSILKGLGKGGLPPIPPASISKLSISRINDHPSPTSIITSEANGSSSPTLTSISSQTPTAGSIFNGISQDQFSVGPTGIDPSIVSALDAELEASLEWIGHPATFGRDSRKAILQTIGVISSQRGYTFRTPIEISWAKRISGVKYLTDRSKEWREETGGEGGIMEEG